MPLSDTGSQKERNIQNTLYYFKHLFPQNSSIFYANKASMFVHSHTRFTKLQMAEGKITKEIWGAALSDGVASLYAPPMLITEQGKHEEESNNEFRG